MKKINNMPLIAALKNRCVKFKVIHNQYVIHKSEYNQSAISDFYLDSPRRENRKDYIFLGKGGVTEVMATLPDGSIVCGNAICSVKDNYNKRVGLRIALQRVFKSIKALENYEKKEKTE